MRYTYDRRHLVVASSAAQILSLIVEKALQRRSTEALVKAYVDELKEDWEDENEGDDPPPQSITDHDKWLARTFGLILTSHELERFMANVFVHKYRQMVRHPVTREEALDVFEFPIEGFPSDYATRTIATAVAEALATRDAMEANQLHAWARERHAPKE
jgi:hypothetical protein